MNEIVTVNSNGEARTTSLAIAEGLEIEHASIIKLVRAYQADLEEFGLVGFEIDVVNRPQGGGTAREIASLNQEQSTLIMTYAKNTEIARTFKKRLVKAFYDLAKRQTIDPAVTLNDPAALRGILLVYTEKVIALEATVADVTPRAEALDLLANTEGNHNLTTSAKVLNIPPQRFISTLQQRHWIYRMGVKGAWTGYADKVENGYLAHKVFMQSLPDGTEITRVQVLVTPRGMARLAMTFNSEMPRKVGVI